jgi:predicted dehydrogenase
VAALAADPNVDLVVVSVKTPDHHAHVRAALEAGKPVFCEWPLAANMEQVRDLADLARTQGIKTFIGVQARGAPILAYARDLVAQGYVGRVLAATMVSATSGLGSLTDRANLYLTDKRNGATTLSIPGGHTLDALCFVLGEFRDVTGVVATQRPTTKIMETGEIVAKTSPDQVVVAGALQSGAVVSAHIQSGVAHDQGVRFEIRGSEGDFIISSSGSWLIEMADLRLQGAQGEADAPMGTGRPLEDLPVPASYRVVPPDMNGFAVNVGQLYAMIARDLREGTSLAPDFQLALKRHELLDAIQRASDTGQRQGL